MNNRFDPAGYDEKPRSNYWFWTSILLCIIPILIICAWLCWILSMMATDEDLYYNEGDNGLVRSTLSSEFSNLLVVGEILPHFILADENNKYIRFEFENNVYFKNMTFDDGRISREARFEELYFISGKYWVISHSWV